MSEPPLSDEEIAEMTAMATEPTALHGAGFSARQMLGALATISSHRERIKWLEDKRNADALESDELDAAQRERILALEEALRELDTFTFLAVHKDGCGEPCDCGWDALERRIPALLSSPGRAEGGEGGR
jgi:hypothetical protein